MTITRRSILKGSLLTGSSLILPKRIKANSVNDLYLGRDTDHSVLAARYREIAVDKAKSLGCDYADVRLVYTKILQVRLLSGFMPFERLGVSVRVLVNGYWGTCSTPIWDEKSVINAVELAYNQAKGNSLGPPRELDLALYNAPGESGEWIMPIQIDPFARNPYEFSDYLWALFSFIQNFPENTSDYNLYMEFQVNNLWFGSTNGSRQFQRTYSTAGEAGFQVNISRTNKIRFDSETLPISGMGYELFAGQDLYTQLRNGYDEVLDLAKLQVTPVNVGRFNMLISGAGSSKLLGMSVGAAMELDRIMGVEANAGGTSYMQDPASELGNFKLGPASLNVNYQRDEPGAAGTRQWDDEGTACSKGILVKSGVIKRAFSNREMQIHVNSADQVAAGNAIAGSHVATPAIYPSNLSMQADAAMSGKKLEDMLKDMQNGVYFRTSNTGLDFQMTNGMISGELYEVKDGVLVSRILGGGCWFRTTELWNNIEIVGSPESLQRIGMTLNKGVPSGTSSVSITAPAIVFKDATIIDTMRK